MKQPLFATMALAGFAASSLAVAAPQSGPVPNFIKPPASAALPAKAAGSTPTVGTPMANAYRAYPPSCASYPLPDKPSGPTYTGSAVGMQPYFAPTGALYFSASETLTATVWRVPCSSSGAAVPYNDAGKPNAMTLVRIDRPDDTVTTTMAMTPQILVIQGSDDATIDPRTNVRVVAEPNTVAADTAYGNPYSLLTKSTTYVLENRADDKAVHFNFNAAFKLEMLTGMGIATVDVPAYAPAADTYPDAGKPLPLDGYAAAQYINAERNEGLIVQVAEGYDSAHPARRQVGLDLLTEDADGKPFWIIGSAAFDPAAGGVRDLDVPVSYLGANNASQDWGTAHVVMTHCNLLTLTFTPKDDLPAGVPSISGPVSYERLLSANGMACE